MPFPAWILAILLPSAPPMSCTSDLGECRVSAADVVLAVTPDEPRACGARVRVVLLQPRPAQVGGVSALRAGVHVPDRLCRRPRLRRAVRLMLADLQVAQAEFAVALRCAADKARAYHQRVVAELSATTDPVIAAELMHDRVVVAGVERFLAREANAVRALVSDAAFAAAQAHP